MDYVCVVLSIEFISNTKYKNYFSTQLLFHGHVASGPLLQIMRNYANDSRYSGFHKIKYGIYI